MFGFTKLAHWVRDLFHKERVQSEMDEELAFHLAAEIENNLKRGLDAKTARQEALRSFGGVAQIQEECRDVRFGTLLETACQDVRYGARMLRRNPGFTCAAVLTLALGIGATTAIFSVVNGVLLRPLPYPQPEQLVYVQEQSADIPLNPFTWPSSFLPWRDRARTLQIAAYMMNDGNFTGGEGEAERSHYGQASAAFFPLLGVQPILGRNFLAEEDRPGGPAVAILSYSFWQRRFAGRSSVLQQTLTLDGKTYAIIGVLPPDLQVIDETNSDYQFWVPFALREKDFTLLRTVGRLQPGASLAQAQAELETIFQTTLSPRQKRVNYHVFVVPWHEQAAGHARLTLLTFLVAVGFVLLIACVNVANLLLARGAARQQEIAVRRALGAGKWRVVRQLLIESVLLALLGGALGLALAYWGKGLLITFLSRSLPLPPIGLDHRVLVFNILLARVVGVGFGMLPALHAAGVSLNDSLKEAGRSSQGGRRRHHLRSALVISEIALATVLLLGAGLLLKSFMRLRGIDPGFKSSGILMLALNLTESKYPTPLDQAMFYQRVQQRLQALGGVKSVALTAAPPLGSGYSLTASGIAVEGHPESDDDSSWARHVSFSTVNADFFRTLDIPLLRGRVFRDTDAAGAPAVAVVNRTFVRHYVPNEDPLGRRIQTPFQRDEWLTIIGVVEDVRHDGLKDEIMPLIYRSYLQAGTPMMNVLVRTTDAPMKMAGAVRGQIATVDRDQPPYEIRSMDEVITDAVSTPRANLLLLGAFATLALALASVGIYSVVAYNVQERTHEIGIRIALGATRGRVLQMIVGRGVLLAVLGIFLGLAAALAMTRLISSLLFGITATDLSTFAMVPLLMLATVLLASYLPSRRAATIDPMAALRCE